MPGSSEATCTTTITLPRQVAETVRAVTVVVVAMMLE